MATKAELEQIVEAQAIQIDWLRAEVAALREMAGSAPVVFPQEYAEGGILTPDDDPVWPFGGVAARDGEAIQEDLQFTDGGIVYATYQPEIGEWLYAGAIGPDDTDDERSWWTRFVDWRRSEATR